MAPGGTAARGAGSVEAVALGLFTGLVGDGAAVPGAKAYRTAPGVAIKPTRATLQIGDVTVSKPIEKGAKEVTFDLTVKPGKKTMSALFESEDGEIHGAYFVYVTKK